MAAPSLFGPLVTAVEVKNALKATVRLWLPTYLRELERLNGIPDGSHAGIRSWRAASDTTTPFPEDQIPAATIFSRGIQPPPVKHGDGSYTVKWIYGVGVRVSARTPEETDDAAKFYAAAIRSLVIQHKSLGGFARSTEWHDENYVGVPGASSRTHAIASVIFIVEVEDVANDRRGPPNAPVATATGVLDPPVAPPDSAPPDGTVVQPAPVYTAWPSATSVPTPTVTPVTKEP